MARVCTNCGARYGDHAQYCNACGSTSFADQTVVANGDEIKQAYDMLLDLIDRDGWEYASGDLKLEYHAIRHRRSNWALLAAWMVVAFLASWFTNVHYLWLLPVLQAAVTWVLEERAQRFRKHMQMLRSSSNKKSV